MPYGTKEHFIDGFIIYRQSGSTLYPSYYLFKPAIRTQNGGHYLNVHISCIALRCFLKVMQYLIFGKKKVTFVVQNEADEQISILSTRINVMNDTNYKQYNKRLREKMD